MTESIEVTPRYVENEPQKLAEPIPAAVITQDNKSGLWYTIRTNWVIILCVTIIICALLLLAYYLWVKDDEPIKLNPPPKDQDIADPSPAKSNPPAEEPKPPTPDYNALLEKSKNTPVDTQPTPDPILEDKSREEIMQLME